MYSNAEILALLQALSVSEAQFNEERHQHVIVPVIERLEDVYELIRNVGNSYGVEGKAAELVENIEERINIVVHKLKFIPEEQRPEVLLINRLVPFEYGGSSYDDLLIRTAGGKPFLMTSEETPDPEILIILSKDKSMAQLLGEVPMVLDLPEWNATAAVKNNQIFFVDGTLRLQRHYAQIADDIELLAEILYPQYFVFGESGESWMKFEL